MLTSQGRLYAGLIAVIMITVAFLTVSNVQVDFGLASVFAEEPLVGTATPDVPAGQLGCTRDPDTLEVIRCVGEDGTILVAGDPGFDEMVSAEEGEGSGESPVDEPSDGSGDAAGQDEGSSDSVEEEPSDGSGDAAGQDEGSGDSIEEEPSDGSGDAAGSTATASTTAPVPVTAGQCDPDTVTLPSELEVQEAQGREAAQLATACVAQREALRAERDAAVIERDACEAGNAAQQVAGQQGLTRCQLDRIAAENAAIEARLQVLRTQINPPGAPIVPSP